MYNVLGLNAYALASVVQLSKTDLKNGPKLVYGSNKWLWLGGLVFHWSFLIIFIRHFRFFIEPVPWCITALEWVDSFFQYNKFLIV